MIDSLPAITPAAALHCQNPHTDCERPPTRWWQGRLNLCDRCHKRFARHENGYKYKAWDYKYKKRERQ